MYALVSSNVRAWRLRIEWRLLGIDDSVTEYPLPPSVAKCAEVGSPAAIPLPGDDLAQPATEHVKVFWAAADCSATDGPAP